MTEPNPSPNPQAAYSKLLNAADKLFAASEELDAQGGIGQFAAGWSPRSREKAIAVLKSARDAIDGHLAELKAMKKAGQGPRKGPARGN